MALSREEIEQIASEVAAKVVVKSGLTCSCRDIDPEFMYMIDVDMPRLGEEGGPELRTKLQNIAKACGYERQNDGSWVQFPRQDAVLQKIGPYTIVQEHDDGDLTIDSRNWGLAVVTTEGQVFTKPVIPLEIH